MPWIQGVLLLGEATPGGLGDFCYPYESKGYSGAGSRELFGKHMILRWLLWPFVLLWMRICMIPRGLLVSTSAREKRTLRLVPPPNCREMGQTGWPAESGGIPPRVFAIFLHAYESKGHSGLVGTGVSGKHMILWWLSWPFVLL